MKAQKKAPIPYMREMVFWAPSNVRAGPVCPKIAMQIKMTTEFTKFPWPCRGVITQPGKASIWVDGALLAEVRSRVKATVSENKNSVYGTWQQGVQKKRFAVSRKVPVPVNPQIKILLRMAMTFDLL